MLTLHRVHVAVSKSSNLEDKNYLIFILQVGTIFIKACVASTWLIAQIDHTPQQW